MFRRGIRRSGCWITLVSQVDTLNILSFIVRFIFCTRVAAGFLSLVALGRCRPRLRGYGFRGRH